MRDDRRARHVLTLEDRPEVAEEPDAEGLGLARPVAHERDGCTPDQFGPVAACGVSHGEQRLPDVGAPVMHRRRHLRPGGRYGILD